MAHLLDDDELREQLALGTLNDTSTQLLRQSRGAGPRIATHQLNETKIADCLRDFGCMTSLPWHETFVVVQDLDSDFQAHDDFQRENAFYDSTLKGVSDAIRKLKQEKIPIDRPADYYAEMLKTDEHMQKVKKRILDESQKIKASEIARKQRDYKKFGKKVQQDVLLRRQKEKSSAIAAATKLRKGLKQQLSNARDDFAVTAEDALGDNGSGRVKGKAKSRDARDKKYGFGGKANNSRSKRNDAESFSEGKRFSVAKNNAGKSSFGRAGKKPNARGPSRGGAQPKSKRPGKSVRAKAGKK